MKLSKCLKNAFEMVLNSKIRSWLTILGIVIGVGAVISIMSLGSSMQTTITRQLDDLGSDIITLTAGQQRATTFFSGRTMPGGGGGGGRNIITTSNAVDDAELNLKDVQILRSIAGISLIDTNIRDNVKVSYLDKSGTVSLTGVDQSIWSRITRLKVKEGRLLDPADSNVIVIGGRLAESYFDSPIRINQMLTIEDNSFRVVGIIDDSSTNIFMPIQMAYQILDNKENNVYDTIIIKVNDVNKLNETLNIIEERLIISRMVNKDNKDFSLTTNVETQQTRNEMMDAMKTFLLAIAAVSLIVGAVGIANTMYTSVLEKTKEIGIMKAIGARNSDILTIFIFNSAIIGLIGGILGIFFGMILSNFLPLLTGNIRFLSGEINISSESIILALFVSIIIGTLSGLFPAYKASKLKPIDALRFE